MCCSPGCSGANCHCDDYCSLCKNCQRCNPSVIESGIGKAGMAALAVSMFGGQRRNGRRRFSSCSEDSTTSSGGNARSRRSSFASSRSRTSSITSIEGDAQSRRKSFATSRTRTMSIDETSVVSGPPQRGPRTRTISTSVFESSTSGEMYNRPVNGINRSVSVCSGDSSPGAGDQAKLGRSMSTNSGKSGN